MKHRIREWTIAEKKYSTFEKHGEYYLFYSDKQGTLVGLLKGANFEQRVEELSKDPNKCIECSVCDLMKAGISIDSGEIVEFGITAQQANEILEAPVFEVKKINENN